MNAEWPAKLITEQYGKFFRKMTCGLDRENPTQMLDFLCTLPEANSGGLGGFAPQRDVHLVPKCPARQFVKMALAPFGPAPDDPVNVFKKHSKNGE